MITKINPQLAAEIKQLLDRAIAPAGPANEPRILALSDDMAVIVVNTTGSTIYPASRRMFSIEPK